MISIINRVRRLLNSHKDGQFVAALGPHELSDLGMSRSELQDLASAQPGTRERMDAMARSLGVDPDAIHRERWREADMARACNHCDERKACGKYLAGDRTGPQPQDFCPNCAQFEELK